MSVNLACLLEQWLRKLTKTTKENSYNITTYEGLSIC